MAPTNQAHYAADRSAPASPHAVDNLGGGKALDAGDNADGSAVAFDEAPFFLMDGVELIVAAFGIDVGPQFVEEGQGTCIREDRDVVDAFEGGQDQGPFGLGVDGAARPFDFANRGVAIEPNDQYVALPRGFDQVGHVASVEDVETAVGPDNGSTLALNPLHDGLQFNQRLDLRAALLSRHHVSEFHF